ncbi:hypothetical protein [Halogeometricum borinquense]|nr:hypothetical protein [Halogeometricum borinquense]
MPSTTATPDAATGPKTRPVLNLVLAGASLLSSASTLDEMNSISPALVAAGFAVTVLALGPVASTEPGRRFGAWFRDIGGAYRLVLVLGFAALVFGTSFAYDISPVTIQTVIFGSVVGLTVHVVSRILSDQLSND